MYKMHVMDIFAVFYIREKIALKYKTIYSILFEDYLARLVWAFSITANHACMGCTSLSDGW